MRSRKHSVTLHDKINESLSSCHRSMILTTTASVSETWLHPTEQPSSWSLRTETHIPFIIFAVRVITVLRDPRVHSDVAF